MAWSVPKVGTVATVASGNLTLTEPAGVAQGDLLVACIAIRSTVGFANGDWSLIESQLSGDTDATFGIASGEMWYCVRGASAPSLVFTRTGGDLGHGRIIAYSGATATPLDTSSSNTLGASSVTATTGTITTAEANELIVAMTSAGDNLAASAFDAATDPTTPSNGTDTTTAPTAGTWIERADAGTNTGADGGLAIADAIRSTAGATGTIQATISGSARHVMIAAAFKMAATESHSGSLTGSGGGGMTAVAAKIALLALLGAGGGGSTETLTGAHNAVLVGAGGGGSTVSQATARAVDLLGAGGGSGTWVGSAGGSEAHSGSLEGSGGGDGTVTASGQRSTALTGDGGGGLVVSSSTDRPAALTGTGGGTGTFFGTSVPSTPLVGTGGGDGSLAVTTARESDATGSGGGSGTVSTTTARAAAITGTGGGSGTFSASTPSSHSGSLTGSGGGGGTFAWIVNRGWIVTVNPGQSRWQMPITGGSRWSVPNTALPRWQFPLRVVQ